MENLLSDSNRSSVQDYLRILGKIDGVCRESLSELTDEIVPKLFNYLADSETKNAGREALEARTEAVSFIRVMKILKEVVSLQSLIVREEAPPWLNKEIDTYYKEKLLLLLLSIGGMMNQKRSRCGVNEEEEHRENITLYVRTLITRLVDGGYLRVPAENELTALICSCGADVVMRE